MTVYLNVQPGESAIDQPISVTTAKYSSFRKLPIDVFPTLLLDYASKLLRHRNALKQSKSCDRSVGGDICCCTYLTNSGVFRFEGDRSPLPKLSILQQLPRQPQDEM